MSPPDAHLTPLSEILIQSSLDGVLAFDRQCRYTLWNPGMEKLSGVSSSQVLGKIAFDVFPFLKEIGEDRYFFDSLEGNDSISTVRPFNVPTSGRSGFFEGHYSPLRDSKDEIIGGMAIIRDVTERVQREANEHMFRTIAESIPQIVWVADGEANVSYFNQRWYDYTGIDHGILDGYMDVVHPEDRLRVLQASEESKIGGNPFEAEYRLRRKDGTYRWFIGRGIEVRVSDGSTLRRFGTATDIHEQKEASSTLEFLNQTGELLMKSLDLKTRIQNACELTVQRFGGFCGIHLLKQGGECEQTAVAHHDPKKRALSEDLNRRHPHKLNDPFGPGAVIRTGQPQFVETLVETELDRTARDPQTQEDYKSLGFKSYICLPLQSDRGSYGSFSILSDERSFTQKDFELAQARAYRFSYILDNARLFEETKAAVRVRDEFLSIASHELKTPLTSLMLQTQMSQKTLSQGDLGLFTHEKLKKLLDSFRKQTTRLTRLIDDMLDIARINSGKLPLKREKFDLSKLVEEVVGNFQEQLLNVGSEIELDWTSPIVGRWDPHRIEQVVSNLLNNSIKYAPGSPIKIHIRLKNVKQTQYAFLVFSDQGPGIPKEHQERIFQRFERAISPTEISGLGLGLYIAREIIKAHEGSIQIQSNLGKGASFIIELPTEPMSLKERSSFNLTR